MKIAVLLKQVPSRESKLRLAADQRWIDEAAVDFELNESDGYALEAALQIKDGAPESSDVIAISIGPDRVDKILRDALAKGADRAIHVQSETIADLSDAYYNAKVLEAALKEENCDLVLSGLQSDDIGMGQTGILLGELMGMATASLVTAIELKDGSLRVKQERESGWAQWLTLPLPASLSIQTGINQPRYPNIKGIMGAKKKPVKVISVADLNVAPPSLQLRRLMVPQKEKRSQMLEASPDQTVAKLVDIMKNELKVL
jgi:electron transfer flavoprotein beta subunit